MEQETEKIYNVSGYPLTVEQQKIIEWQQAEIDKLSSQKGVLEWIIMEW